MFGKSPCLLYSKITGKLFIEYVAFKDFKVVSDTFFFIVTGRVYSRLYDKILTFNINLY
jgi:hypothetical protein